LTQTPNEAAVTVLAAALDSPHPLVREGALRALTHRRDAAAHMLVLDRFNQLTSAEIRMIRNAGHRMQTTLRAVLSDPNSAACKAACQAMIAFHDFDLIVTLLEAIETEASEFGPANLDHKAGTLVELAAQLQDAVSQPPRDSRLMNPHTAKARVVAALAAAADRITKHQCREVVVAFLMLVPHDHAVLRELLSNTFHPAQPIAFEILRANTSPGVLRLVFELFKDTKTSMEVLQLIASRSDVELVGYLLRSLKRPIPLRVRNNLARIHSVNWLQDSRDVLFACSGAEQATAVELAVATGMRRAKVLSLLSALAEQGQAEGRRAAIDALADFPGPRADSMVRRALDDSDPIVQAAAVRQLRRRKLPDALATVVAKLDAEDVPVREAARESLSEFTFVRYITAYPKMSQAERRVDGRIVGKVDVRAADGLRRELKAPSPSIRLRAVQVAENMELIADVADTLVSLLRDNREDLGVRAAAARVLGRCQLPAAEQALHELATDAPPALRQDVLESLISMNRQPTPIR
jgi:HEAT repeat protein